MSVGAIPHAWLTWGCRRRVAAASRNRNNGGQSLRMPSTHHISADGAAIGGAGGQVSEECHCPWLVLGVPRAIVGRAGVVVAPWAIVWALPFGVIWVRVGGSPCGDASLLLGSSWHIRFPLACQAEPSVASLWDLGFSFWRQGGMRLRHLGHGVVVGTIGCSGVAPHSGGRVGTCAEGAAVLRRTAHAGTLARRPERMGGGPAGIGQGAACVVLLGALPMPAVPPGEQ